MIADIKANGPKMIAKCLNEDWPENTPIAKSMFKGLEGLLDHELERRGIKAQTEFFNRLLSPESEEMYKIMIDQQASYSSDSWGWDFGKFETSPADRPE